MNDMPAKLSDSHLDEAGPYAGDIETDLVNQLYRQAYPLTFGFPAAAIVIAFFLFERVPLDYLLAWCLFIVMVSIYRGYITRAYFRTGPEADDARTWIRRYMGIELCSGLAAGMSGAFFPFLPFSYQAMLLFVVSAQNAGGATLLAPKLRVYFSFFLPSSLLIIFWLLLQGDEEPRIVAYLMPIYMMLMVGVVRSINGALVDSYRLKHKNSGLLAHGMALNKALTKASDEALSANRELTRLNQTLELRVEDRTREIKREMEQRMRTEQALRRSHSFRRYLVDNLPQRVFHKDAYSVYISCNKRYAQDLGIEPEDIAGTRDWDYFPPELAHKYREDDQRIMRGGVSEELEEYYVTQSGKRCINTVKTPLNDENGEVIGILGIFWDITEQKKDAEARRKLEQRMHQIQKLEAIGRLASGISHEVNTPTQYIGDNIRFLQVAFTDLQKLMQARGRVLQAVEHHAELRELLEQVQEAEEEIDLQDLETEIPKAISQSMDGIERISNIVQAMKEFSHPGSAHKELTDINRALRTTVEICRNEWKYHARIQFDLAPELPAVPVYPGELNQVILNLVVNAAHAIAAQAGADDGLIRIHTRLRGDWVEIGISDNGCGMGEEVKTRMFEPFFTTKELGKGSGQGLAIAHSVVVDRHSGQIAVDTAPGEGARFSIRLPLHEQSGQSVPD